MAAQASNSQAASFPASQAGSAGSAAGHGQQAVPMLVCQSWADAIVRYWEELLAGGALDSAAPLCVVDLGGPDGMLAWALPAALAARLRASPCAGWRVHYLACAGAAQLLDASLAINPIACV